MSDDTLATDSEVDQPVDEQSPETEDDRPDLDDEAEIAADYLEELLDIADLDGDIEILVQDGRSYITIDSEDSGDLSALSDPETVTALQELTRVAVQTRTGLYSRLILDIAGSREARSRELEALVEEAAEALREGRSEFALPAMSSYERKLIHDFVADRGLRSESRGEGRDRHTVILPQ